MAMKPIIVTGDDVRYPEPIRRQRFRLRLLRPGEFDRLRSWWRAVEVDLTLPPIFFGEFAWLLLLVASWLQPFTPALHFLWMAVLVSLQAGAFWRLALYVRENQATPPIEVRGEMSEEEEDDDDY